MLEILEKLFIKSSEDDHETKIREKYGTVISIFSIICNFILVVLKLIASFITNSVSIRIDAFNNLSDAGSNVASLFGFKLSSKHADSDHPYGHGRIEYVSGLIISFLILVMGGTAFIDAFKKIINPEELTFSYAGVIILVLSIAIKLLMHVVNKQGGEKIDSTSLKAAAQDSLNDSVMTFSTLVTAILYKLTHVNIDAYIAAIVSIFVLKSGIDIFKDVLSTILGQAPDKEFVKEIEKYVSSYDVALGIHDLMFHDYGPASRFMTLHVEVDSKGDILKIHDEIDNIEKGILDKFNVMATIHMDPIVTNDSETIKYKDMIKKIVKEMNQAYRFHDFRMVKGPSHINLVFDMVIPANDKSNHETIRKELEKRAKDIDATINIVVEIEHSYVD